MAIHCHLKVLLNQNQKHNVHWDTDNGAHYDHYECFIHLLICWYRHLSCCYDAINENLQIMEIWRKNSIRFDVFLRSIHHRLDILVVWVVDVRRLEDCHILRQEDQLSVNIDRAINRWLLNIQYRPRQHTVSGLCRPTSETQFEWRFADGQLVARFYTPTFFNLSISLKLMLDNIVLVNYNDDRDIYMPQNVLFPHWSGEWEIDLSLGIFSYQLKAGPIFP